MIDTLTDAEMDAALALNVEVAERVMGWTWAKVGFYWDRGDEMYLVPPEGPTAVHKTTSGSWDFLGNDRNRRVLFDLPSYSTDIGDAWDVHLVMCDQRFSKRLRYIAALHEQSRSKEGLPDGLHALIVLRDRFPEAICRAALAVMAA